MHLALYFPGGYGPGQDPFDNYFSWTAIKALRQTGAYVVPVRYDDHSLSTDRQRFETGIRREVKGALAHHEPTRLTLVGKSRGGHALGLIVREGFDLPEDTRFIWLTPSWQLDRTWDAARANTHPSLYVVGLGDHEYHLPDRHETVPGDTIAIPDGDHGLEVPGDVLATLNAIHTMADAILRFASRSKSTA